MNILITTRCNFSCIHCLYSCTSKGEDMPLETFEKAIAQSDRSIQIFGGEPTLHPNFFEYVKLASEKVDVNITTNGSKFFNGRGTTKLFKNILELKNSEPFGEIRIRVSNSFWHKPFQKFNPNYYYYHCKYQIELLNVSDIDIIQLGRAKNLDIAHNSKCRGDIHNWWQGPPQIAVFPNGEVAQCCAGKMIFTNINIDENIWETYSQLANPEYFCNTCPKYNSNYIDHVPPNLEMPP